MPDKKEVNNLSEEQMVRISLLFRKFKKGEITYHEMVTLLISDGIIYLEPLKIDPSGMKLLRDYQAFQTRCETQEYLPTDIKGLRYQQPNGELKTLKIDREFLLLLAKHGDAESIATLEKIEKFEHKHVPTYQPQHFGL